MNDTPHTIITTRVGDDGYSTIYELPKGGAPYDDWEITVRGPDGHMWNVPKEHTDGAHVLCYITRNILGLAEDEGAERMTIALDLLTRLADEQDTEVTHSTADDALLDLIDDPDVRKAFAAIKRHYA